MTETIAALDRLDALRSALEGVALPLEVAGADAARDARRAAVRQVDDYIRPRLSHLDAPLLAVVGGSTGAGKSTLVNALVGHPVTRTGVIRPTTRQPILLHSPADAAWFASTRILPGLARITGVVREAPAHEAGDDPDAALVGSVVLVADERVPRDLAILDAPDVDSIADENRRLAAQLLAAADLWLFSTTANRYADAVPWGLLDDAAARDITVGVVLNRVPPGAEAEIEADLRQMLGMRGLGSAPVFVVPESPLDAQGMLPEAAIAPIRRWLQGIAGDRAERARIAGRTLAGAVDRLGVTARAIADARDEQLVVARDLRDSVRTSYDDAAERVGDATRDGVLLRGEVLARWQDFVGTSDVFRTVESWYSRARDRVVAWFEGRPAPAVEVEHEIESGLHAVMVDQAGRAASDAWSRVRQSAVGRQLTSGADLAHPSPDLSERASRLVRDWQQGLIELITEQAAGKRTKARVMSLGLNVITVALMVVVFGSTGGLTGAELAIAGGSAVVGQKLLETIFGEDAVRRLAAQARDDLEVRVRALMADEAARWDALLEPVEQGTTADALRDSAAELAVAMRRVGRAPAPDAAGTSHEVQRSDFVEGEALPDDDVEAPLEGEADEVRELEARRGRWAPLEERPGGTEGDS
ncbi:dynamin family protein [Agrococcus sp. HG114]|uniref:dynamin family protein n=1 Tax=Agrococcus sp. HG114 TaxID=2969757 RepID=UPI00215B7188|nr:dynamin family protein [Agrococcus sp. HG114]MCR8670620.1 dynamin family protein [Agrococcus sp. HG114]